MKISPLNIQNRYYKYNTAFGKKHLGTTNVRKNEEASLDTLSFVEYNPTNYRDRTQLYDLAEYWKDAAPWIEKIIERVRMLNTSNPQRNSGLNFHFYGLEDENGKTLVIAETVEPDFIPDEVKLAYIQVNPFQGYTASKRKYAGLGESLMAKIVETAQKNKKDRIILHSSNNPFWESSSLFQDLPDESKDMKCIGKDKFQDYIDFVEAKKKQHTT